MFRRSDLLRSLVYHVYNRGNGKRDIFHDREDRLRFVRVLEDYTWRFPLEIYHWVLMSNHYHLLMRIAVPRMISAVMSGIAVSYIRWHHRKYNSAGHLFQGRFQSQPVENDSYHQACGRYIERNPVRAGMCALAEEYEFSSAGFYVRGRADGLTVADPFYEEMGADDEERQRVYREFLTKWDAEEERLFADMQKPVGSPGFLGRLVKERGVYVLRKGRPRTRQAEDKFGGAW